MQAVGQWIQPNEIRPIAANDFMQMSSQVLLQSVFGRTRFHSWLHQDFLVNGKTISRYFRPILSWSQMFLLLNWICLHMVYLVRSNNPSKLFSLCTEIRRTIGNAPKGNRHWMFLNRSLSSKCLAAILGIRQGRLPRAEMGLVDRRYRCFGAVPCLNTCQGTNLMSNPTPTRHTCINTPRTCDIHTFLTLIYTWSI